MKQLRSREMVRMLLDRGWHEYSQRGSHRRFKHPDNPALRAIVPIHPSEPLTPGVQRSIMRVAVMAESEL